MPSSCDLVKKPLVSFSRKQRSEMGQILITKDPALLHLDRTDGPYCLSPILCSKLPTQDANKNHERAHVCHGEEGEEVISECTAPLCCMLAPVWVQWKRAPSAAAGCATICPKAASWKGLPAPSGSFSTARHVRILSRAPWMQGISR